MERSCLQEQAALSNFDGFRDSQALSCVKPTAAPAPSLAEAWSRVAPEAGQSVDVVYDPKDAAADWSGFTHRHCAGRRMHARPAAHKESIARSEEHGIVPALDAKTMDSIRIRRRRCVEPTAKPGEGLLLAGSAAPRTEERFTTCARAANDPDLTTRALHGQGSRCTKASGKRHIAPAYERDTTRGTSSAEGRQAGGNLWAPPGTPMHYDYRAPRVTEGQETAQNFRGGCARAANGPGSFLKGLGRKVAESGADVGNGPSSGKRDVLETRPAREDALRNKDLYAANYNPYVAGYTGYRPRR